MKVTTDACLFGAWVAREVKARSFEIRNMLDIGTGTGLLTLMVAQKKPDLIIDAVEIDRAAYTQAKENIIASGFNNKIYLQNEDILNDTSQRKYDVIISNPPFYEKELKSVNARKNIAHHDDGLPLEKLLPVIKTRLLATSKFYLLLPYKRKRDMEVLFKENDLFFTKIISVRQSVDHDLFRLIIEGSLYHDYELKETEISIRDNKDQYTPDFINLLKDYYLHL